MWEKLFDALKNLIVISTKVERHEKEIDSLKTEVRNLSNLVQALLSELRHVSEQRQADRDFIQVWIEKEMLKFERRLPSSKEEKSDDKKD